MHKECFIQVMLRFKAIASFLRREVRDCRLFLLRGKKRDRLDFFSLLTLTYMDIEKNILILRKIRKTHL